MTKKLIIIIISLVVFITVSFLFYSSLQRSHLKSQSQVLNSIHTLNLNGYQISIPPEFFDTRTAGKPIELKSCRDLTDDIQFYDSDENLIFVISEESKNREIKKFMEMHIPQASTNLRYENININENIFTKLTYDNYSLPELTKYVNTEFSYGIDLGNKYLLISNVEISDKKMQEILSTFKISQICK